MFFQEISTKLKVILKALRKNFRPCVLKELRAILRFILGALEIHLEALSGAWGDFEIYVRALEIHFSHLNHCQHIVSP